MAPQIKQWQKRYLIPIWVIELIVIGIYFIIAIIGLSLAQDVSDSLDDPNYTKQVLSTAYGIVIGFAGLCLLLTIIEVILAAMHKLKPVFHLSSACVKAVILLVYFILSVAGAASVGGGSIVSIILALIATIAAVCQVIYGSVVMHRTRKGLYNHNNNHGDVTYKGVGQVELEQGRQQQGGVIYQ